MTHQVLDRDLPIRRHRVENRIALRVHHGDTHVGELWKVFRERIVHEQRAALVERQGRNRGKRLGHRRDAEDRVGGHPHAGRPVSVAERFEVDQLALAGDGDDRTGKPAGSDVGVEHAADRRETIGRHARLIGTSARQRIAGVRRRACCCTRHNRLTKFLRL